jgi:hypothetical protein
MNKTLRNTGIAVALVGTASALAALFVRNRISRYRRDLFSSRTVRRLGALRHVSQAEASVDNINLLRDFIAWEPRSLLRKRARSIIQRMQEEVRAAQSGSDGSDAPSA